jgi:hypothetical protein
VLRCVGHFNSKLLLDKVTAGHVLSTGMQIALVYVSRSFQHQAVCFGALQLVKI